MNPKIFIVFFCFLSLSVFSQNKKTTLAPDKFAGIDTALARVLKASKAAGFAVAVVVKNKIIYAKGFGLADVENNKPATEKTLYAIGSCSKAFTSAIIGGLQKEGKLDIDKPVRNYLPELNFYNNDMNDHITLRDMMCHRTGLSRHDVSWYLFPTTRDSLLTRIKYMEPTYGLREKWQYNNFMFFAQGKVAEKLTGKSWETNVKEKLFAPLGMTASNMPYEAVKGNALLAVPYDLHKDSSQKKVPHYNIGGMGPAGAIYSNVQEMANWVMAWIYGGKFNGKEIIPAAFAKEAMSSQMVSNGAPPDAEKSDLMFGNYGFGWSVSSYKSHYRVEHGGNIDGFSANTSFFPTDSIGIIVLTNQNGSWVPAVVRNIIADRMLNLPNFDWTSDRVRLIEKGKRETEAAKKLATSSQKKGTTPSHNLKDYEGLYSHPAYGTMEVVYEQDSIFALVPGKKIWLEHYHYDVFVPFIIETGEAIDTADRSNMRFMFNTTEGGDIGSLSAIGFEAPSIKLEFVKTPKPKAVKKADLQPYVGEYDLAGTIIKIYIKGENTLTASIPGQTDYELVPIAEKDKFSIKILSGYSLLFERKENDEISAVSFIQPNGTFKANRKK